jgi:hypothetical protein
MILRFLAFNFDFLKKIGLNLHLIEDIANVLNIKVEMVRSSEFSHCDYDAQYLGGSLRLLAASIKNILILLS